MKVLSDDGNPILYEGISLDLSARCNWVAIVGSRNVSSEELELAHKLAYECAKQGKIIISGLAKGIDATAHQGAIDAGGKTIAIVNTPSFQEIYPKENRHLAKEIKKNGGIIFPYKNVAVESTKKGLSQFSKRLIERDLLLAHLSSSVITVKAENGVITGGTKWAFNEAGRLGKKIFLLDLEGNLNDKPLYEERSIFWNMEMNINLIIKEINKFNTSKNVDSN